jgi:hypothetical protein
MKYPMKPLITLCTAVLCLSGLAAEKMEPSVTLEGFQLVGEFSRGHAAFTLNALARVQGSRGASLALLQGPVALTEPVSNPKWRLQAEDGRFLISFDRSGNFPVQLKFEAAITQSNGWNQLGFTVAPSTLQPIRLRGLPADTQVEFAAAARPKFDGEQFTSYLAGDGEVKLRWKEARAETEGKLFFAAEMLSQISVSPGLLRQTGLLDFKVMQGELKSLSFLLRGTGEVTRVQGDHVLSWNLLPSTNTSERRLVVQFNQPQKDQFGLQIQSQAPLGAFPQTAEVLQLRPESATRFAGYFRIVNDGAVRLEVAQASGLSQISPEQFPETEMTRAVLRPVGTQRFAYRFSGPDFSLRIQADQILPELTVSELLNYHLGENEVSIDCEFELDVREVPLRELSLRVPRGYAIAQLTAASLSDYFLVESDNQTDAELRLVFGQPISGRQITQLRLERNKPLAEAAWVLPRPEVTKAKSTRGHIAVTADTGFRLSPERISGLTEIATAFFPRKLTGIQSAFRLSEPAWQATMRIERLPQTLQADGLHLFSIGEGIAYGSSVINYVVSGAPVSTFRIELSEEYFNVEFTGKDVRNWQKIAGGYLVQLHTPVSGSYTLLATYERPFKPQGETLTFTGARPLDAHSEQGHTLVISAYQFQVKPVDVSAGLLPLEAGEVPAEYRLLFDAPILAAYRYTARPFNLRLGLSPLAQGDSLSLIVDRAALTTRVSKEGQVLTDARYFVKNRGNPHLRVMLPAGTRLWSAAVNGVSVVPVTDANSNLIPMPSAGDPNGVLTLDLKLASVSTSSTKVHIGVPTLSAPVMLAEWKLAPDTGQRLIYQGGSLTPAGAVTDSSGFAQLIRTFDATNSAQLATTLLPGLALIVLGVIALRWASGATARFNNRHVIGLLFGACSFVIAAVLINAFADYAVQQRAVAPRDLTFLAPVQQAGSSLTVDVLNLEEKSTILGVLHSSWPLLFALPLWSFAWLSVSRSARGIAIALGWSLLAWTALRFPNGANLFLMVMGCFLLVHLIVPMLIQSWRLPPVQKDDVLVSKPNAGTASACLALFVGVYVCLSAQSGLAFPVIASISQKSVMADLVTQEIRVENGFVFATARIHWQGDKGQNLPLLFEPAVLTSINYPKDSLSLQQAVASSEQVEAMNQTNQIQFHQLVVKRAGVFDLELHYELPVLNCDNEAGFYLPIQSALANQLSLKVADQDVDVSSPGAVSIHREMAGADTVADLVLSPATKVWVAWKPRSRDVKTEKPVFYAELSQLYAPTAGVIEGLQHVSVRLAQGELSELVLDVPAGITISDVLEASRLGTPPAEAKTVPAAIVSLWRFDPDARKLRVSLSPPQARPFALLIKSQIATSTLPFEQSLGTLGVLNAAEQVGLVGLATGNEVQLDSAISDTLSPINLEDFPSGLVTALQPQVAGLTLRRAFRYGHAGATILLKASSVEPEVRVESQETVSLGEDRTVLAANVSINITRAGIFRLSFVMPPGFDVESISGSALSHWTESKSDANRVITLQLNGKTEGQQQFAISLMGPGTKATNGWKAPHLTLREASKHTGTILLVPEQGLRLQLASSEGLTQLDPQKSGIKQKGVLAFRVLQISSTLVLNIEQVDSWIQVNSLQHAIVSEAQTKVVANLQYQIENTGLKSFRVLVPTNAENVRFQGEQISDSVLLPGTVTNGLAAWEVKLHRRILGSYLLQITYQVPVPENATEWTLRGVQAADVNVQRGYVTVQSGGRLQVRVDSAPAALQPAEWQGIPRALQQGLPASAANFSYRLVEAGFELPLHLERYQAAQLLPGRVNSITFSSVISDDGVMLTQAKLEMFPGQKRLLRMTLPPEAHFWFAFVNQSGVWPWREQDQILIPLEQQAIGDKAAPVELFYTCRIGAAGRRALDLQLLAPKFDLPLENITWRVSLSEKWKVEKWSGSLQLQSEETVAPVAGLDLQNYLQNEILQQQERTKKAEDLLAAANSALAQGEPQQARRAFQSAYGLSTHDAAFNEDARVQLHNIKLQEALVGLNVRQAVSAGDGGGLSGKLKELRDRKVANYTQQDAKDIIERNTSDENAAFMRLAERLIQQQDAAATTPAALHASVPEQGRVLTFKRAMLVDPWASLNIGLKAKPVAAATWLVRVGIVAGTLVILFTLTWLTARPERNLGQAKTT